ncbi:UdgX family uracil-DNA binding protein [Saccharothrix longispora]|uniref:UdgX family uracil-DNA binding protein n=1 Tax=Saccharothrix longispora TaxID=33920 RepID=UPI0028FD6370|nr:UdgX family uracil-DNA binding protein [Saccharothrix longispora]MDU0289144.1 UdgX family uracil-DNA binding protein [Saccharothrix longispora]
MTGKKAGSAASFVPEGADLAALRRAAASCEGCHLHAPATRTVFGAGPPDARLVLVGEQPGDAEDREGEPFVGPAGRLLDKALAETGLDRAGAYLTNAVKHFKFEERGKRRIHKSPARGEVVACLPWLEAELAQVEPDLVVCLGATAAKAVLGTSFKVTEQRGRLQHAGEQAVIATVHPSAILRAPDRDEAYRGFVADLRVVHDHLYASS